MSGEHTLTALLPTLPHFTHRASGTGPEVLLSPRRRRIPLRFPLLHRTMALSCMAPWLENATEATQHLLESQEQGFEPCHAASGLEEHQCSMLTARLLKAHSHCHQGINALINGRAQVTQRSSVCQAKPVPSSKELCFCR